MRMFKLGFMVVCVCSIVLPVLANDVPSGASVDASAGEGMGGVDNGVRIKINKNVFMDRMAKTINDLDINADGTIDAEELASAKRRHEQEMEDKKASQATSFTPIVSEENEKSYTNRDYQDPSIGVSPVNADQIQK